MVWFSPDAVQAVQSALAPLEPLWLLLTRLGDGPLYIVLMGLAYWCVDKSKGFRLGMLLLVSAEANTAAKEAFAAPRPPRELWLDSMVAKDPAGGGFGLPSGHAQSAAVFWGGLRLRWRLWWLLLLGLPLIAGVSLSRIALGVHFPGDVAGGLLLGGLLLGLDAKGGDRLANWGAGLAGGARWALALVPGLAALALLAWRPVADLAGTAGLLLGFPVGYLMEARWVGMSRPVDLRRAGFRLAVGLGTVFVFYYAGTAFGRTDPAVAFPSSFGLALMATVGAPWVFRKLRL
ncbi:MAG: phosphatase PAP2 family protein [Halobacteria archaeon]